MTFQDNYSIKIIVLVFFFLIIGKLTNAADLEISSDRNGQYNLTGSDNLTLNSGITLTNNGANSAREGIRLNAGSGNTINLNGNIVTQYNNSDAIQIVNSDSVTINQNGNITYNTVGGGSCCQRAFDINNSTNVTINSAGNISYGGDYYEGFVYGYDSSFGTINMSGTYTENSTREGQALVRLQAGQTDRVATNVTISTSFNSSISPGSWGTAIVRMHGSNSNNKAPTITNLNTSGTNNASGDLSAINLDDGSKIINFTNTGSLVSSGSSSNYAIKLRNAGNQSTDRPSEITNFVNKGTLTGHTYDIQADETVAGSDPTDWMCDFGMGDVSLCGQDGGKIVTFSNYQGASDPVKYNGKLPENYKIIIDSSSYGKVIFSNSTGSTNFAIDSDNSNLSAGTYSSVIDGLTTGFIGSTRSGTSGSYNWELRLATGDNDTWDLIISNSRTGYTSRITGKLNKILSVLEQINTDQSNTSLTSTLDNLSDIQLEKVASQIEGATIKSTNGQSFKNHSTFKRFVSSALSSPSVNSLTRNNYASLNLSDLNMDLQQNSFQSNIINDFDFKSMASIFSNKDLFSLKSKGSTFFLRTFADQANQEKIGSDAGYESTTTGILIGNQNNLTDEIEQGWSLGYSSNDNDFDDSYGQNKTSTLHAMIYQNQQYDQFTLGINLGTYISRGDLDRKITDGTPQTLKSRSYNYGADVTVDIKRSYFLKNDLTFVPSFSTNISYIIQDDLDETGGDLALAVKNENLLIIKPEIGFALDKNFKNVEQISKSFGISTYVSHEEKLEGTSSKAKIKYTGSNFDIVDENKNDTFITAGIGFSEINKIKDSTYNFGFYYTKNKNNNLNSSLLSYNYSKKF